MCAPHHPDFCALLARAPDALDMGFAAVFAVAAERVVHSLPSIAENLSLEIGAIWFEVFLASLGKLGRGGRG